MKQLIVAALLALTSVAFSATLSPIQLLNPAGSTSGQVITSTGPTTAPAWTTVTLSGLGGLAAANNLSDVGSVSTARANLGLGTAATQNTGTSGATVPLLNGANTWAAFQTFSVRPTFNSATPWDSANLANPAATTGTLAQFAATTSAQLAGVLSDETGSGAAVFGTSPTITTPGIVGVTNGSAAAAGQVGEIICAQVTNGGTPTGCQTNSNTPVSLTNITPTNVTSITLTAGDWDVWGFVLTNPNASSVQSNTIASISTVSATIQAPFQNTLPFAAATGLPIALPVAPRPINVTTSTTVYLIGYCGFTSTNAAYGYIVARRRH